MQKVRPSSGARGAERGSTCVRLAQHARKGAQPCTAKCTLLAEAGAPPSPFCALRAAAACPDTRALMNVEMLFFNKSTIAINFSHDLSDASQVEWRGGRVRLYAHVEVHQLP